MKYGKVHAVAALAMTAVLTGCGGASDEPAATKAADTPVSVPSAESTAAESTAEETTDTAANPEAPNACELLTIAEIKQATGLVVSVRTDTPDRCIWVVKKPKDSHYGGLTIGVKPYASAAEAEEQFKWFVDEKVPGIGDEASVRDNGLLELTVRVAAAHFTISGQNPAITRDVLFDLGRTAAGHAA